MNFQKGDKVVHCSYGLGEILQLEERTLYGRTITYYAVRIDDMTVWVPADEKLESRLRVPMKERDFKRLFDILKRPGETLPDDRQARKEFLRERLKDGRAESLCLVIRSLEDFHLRHSLNENDQLFLKRAQHALVGEWGYSLSISVAQADHELHLLLASVVGKGGKP